MLLLHILHRNLLLCASILLLAAATIMQTQRHGHDGGEEDVPGPAALAPPQLHYGPDPAAATLRWRRIRARGHRIWPQVPRIRPRRRAAGPGRRRCLTSVPLVSTQLQPRRIWPLELQRRRPSRRRPRGRPPVPPPGKDALGQPGKKAPPPPS
ncbi:hypothetical protein C2845_PM01G18680 [Panicum miliaceum]|uniref:Uncharacterized protein n=1 Tax=Panicum miliaceum TaxID=4540 RepID=A0A3L6TM07_PANMI|nr:hypothetical protein C2845_PM01G18680 [Panicum miliaceum]